MRIFKKNPKDVSGERPIEAGKWHGHPFVVPVITFFILFFASCWGFILSSGETIGANDSKVVRLYVDGQERSVPTRAKTVSDLLARLDIKIEEQDVVEPSLDAPIIGDKFTVNVYRAQPVTIVDETGHKTVARIAERAPLAIAKKAGYTIYPEDIVELSSPQEALRDGIVGAKLVIDRATPITLSLYGSTYAIRTQASTVAELAQEKKVDYTRASVFPAPETTLKANDIVFITDPGKQIAVSEEAVAQETKFEDNPALDIGVTKTKEEGAPGKKVVVYESSADGTKKVLQEVVVLQPQTKLVSRGTKPKPGFDGGFEAALASLRSCEGAYSSNTGNGYYGAYQFDKATWNGYGGHELASDAPPLVQDQKAKETYMRRGWSPWPGCTVKLGLQDIYR